mgnify:CR=1 FL=1
MIEIHKIDIEFMLDFCARESCELPLNAGFVFELKIFFLFLNYININLVELKNCCIFAVGNKGWFYESRVKS